MICPLQSVSGQVPLTHVPWKSARLRLLNDVPRGSEYGFHFSAIFFHHSIFISRSLRSPLFIVLGFYGLLIFLGSLNESEVYCASVFHLPLQCDEHLHISEKTFHFFFLPFSSRLHVSSMYVTFLDQTFSSMIWHRSLAARKYLVLYFFHICHILGLILLVGHLPLLLLLHEAFVCFVF